MGKSWFSCSKYEKEQGEFTGPSSNINQNCDLAPPKATFGHINKIRVEI